VNGRFRISGLPHGRYAVVGGRDEVVADQIEHSQPADYQLLVR
jgi:hypothetical protein